MVWWDDPEHVYLYDLNTGQTITVHATNGARFPDVSVQDRLVVWQEWHNDQWDLYSYQLDTHSEQALLVALGDQEIATVANGLVAYQQRQPGAAWQIFLYELSTQRAFPLSDDANPQVNAAAAGNHIIWQDIRNHQTDIYRFDWTGEQPPIAQHPVSAPIGLQVGAVTDGRLFLQWQDQATDEAGFQLERAQGITGTAWSLLATLPPNTTQYTDTPGSLGESFWYRVRAYNPQGNSAYTSDSFNSTVATVPSANELYLMALINEARVTLVRQGQPVTIRVDALKDELIEGEVTKVNQYAEPAGGSWGKANTSSRWSTTSLSCQRSSPGRPRTTWRSTRQGTCM